MSASDANDGVLSYSEQMKKYKQGRMKLENRRFIAMVTSRLLSFDEGAPDEKG
jgi:hypothetical protein